MVETLQVPVKTSKVQWSEPYILCKKIQLKIVTNVSYPKDETSRGHRKLNQQPQLFRRDMQQQKHHKNQNRGKTWAQNIWT